MCQCEHRYDLPLGVRCLQDWCLEWTGQLCWLSSSQPAPYFSSFSSTTTDSMHQRWPSALCKKEKAFLGPFLLQILFVCIQNNILCLFSTHFCFLLIWPACFLRITQMWCTHFCWLISAFFFFFCRMDWIFWVVKVIFLAKRHNG